VPTQSSAVQSLGAERRERIERGFLSYEGGGFDLRLVVEWAWLTACLFKKNLCEFGDYRTVCATFLCSCFFFRRLFFDISDSVAEVLNSFLVVEVIITHFSPAYQSLHSSH
jgi:hypothetical protein